MMAPKGHFEINWPLVASFVLYDTLNQRFVVDMNAYSTNTSICHRDEFLIESSTGSLTSEHGPPFCSSLIWLYYYIFYSVAK